MTTTPTQFDMDGFYSEQSIPEWQQIIGSELHYHFGYFKSDEDLETGLRQTVRNFYPFIENGTHILDLGCGWGGPAQLLIHEKQCRVEGITVSASQKAYCQQLGLNVHQLDAEIDDITGRYDTVFMLEVLCHIFNKAELLNKLRPLAPRLAMSTVCCSENFQGDHLTFGESIKLVPVSELMQNLKDAGWTVTFSQNRRFPALRTAALWKQNLDKIYGNAEPPGQLSILRSHAEIALANPAEWCTTFPLIDIVAE